MHTVEMLQEAIEAARRQGFEVRQDWLGGNGGGHCIVRGRKWLLLDLAQTVEERLAVLTNALRGENVTVRSANAPQVAEKPQLRRAA